MSHTSTYRSTIQRVDPQLLARSIDVLRRVPGVQIREQVSGYQGRGGVFDYALQPTDRHCFLGLGIRIDPDGTLEFGEDSSDRNHLGTFLDQQRQQVLKSYASVLVMEAAMQCGYQPEVLHEGVPGEPNRIALTLLT
jgi:hypothetical protein